MPSIETTLGDEERAHGDTDTFMEVNPETPSDDAPGPELGKGAIVGRYRIVERLGAGGMGVVYRAHDPQLDREVALKLLRPKSAGEREIMASRMLREAKSAARIRHPNVVTVYDAGEVDGRAFIAMELMSGTDLAKWFRDQRPWREVVRVMLQAARGLRAAHESGIVHRDFKPDNVVLEDDGNVKVLDFGLARVAYDGETQTRVAEELAGQLAATGIEGLDTLTHTGALVGTPAYMAPEQYLQRPLDARTDQFSFCVALFSGVYGQRPFGGRNHAVLTMNVVQGNLEEPEDPSVAPARLLEILRKGLATDPDDRFPTMDALIGELRALLEHEGARAMRSRTRRWIAGGIVSAVAAALIGLAVIPDDFIEVSVDAPAVEPPAIEPQAPPPTEPPAEPPAEPPELALELMGSQGIDARTRPGDGPQIWISPDTLRIIEELHADPRDIPLQAGRITDAATPTTEMVAISPMVEAFARARPDASTPLALYIDRQTPFATVVRTVFTASHVGFDDFEFAVRDGETIAAFEIESPRFAVEVQPRRHLALALDVRADRVLVGVQLWPQDDELGKKSLQWPLDLGSGSCELPLGEAATREKVQQLEAPLSFVAFNDISVVVAARDDVTWEQIAAMLDAAPAESGLVLQAQPLGLDDCRNPITLDELETKFTKPRTDEDEPQFRRWCFINSSLKSKKVCRSTQAACIAEARHWVDKPRESCQGEP